MYVMLQFGMSYIKMNDTALSWNSITRGYDSLLSQNEEINIEMKNLSNVGICFLD